MKRLKIFILLSLSIALLASVTDTYAGTNIHLRRDSITVTQWLKEADSAGDIACPTLYFAQKFMGKPYISKTLEGNAEERLIVNVRELDCTTLVENVMALAKCHAIGKSSFADFRRQLTLVRYEKGLISYGTRLHYFSKWIDQHCQEGWLREITTPHSPLTVADTLAVHYMSAHPKAYPMLQGEAVRQIKSMEQELTGKPFAYIPKSMATDKQLRNVVRDGDIIAIVTNIPGLDISHVGIAKWRNGVLHLVNASTIHRKVVEEPRSLFQYLARNKRQTGIRVLRPLMGDRP